MFAIGIVGTLFTVFKFIRDPQAKSDKTDALLEQRLNMRDEATEKRFKEINANFLALLSQSQNHIHTVDTKVENLNKTLSEVGKEIVRLSTIIEERIPKK